MEPLQIGIALVMITAVVVGVVGLRTLGVKDATRRRTAMMKRLGFEPKLVSVDDPQTKADGKMVRYRCRLCIREDECESWLKGETGGDNDFCPNADTFRELSGEPGPGIRGT